MLRISTSVPSASCQWVCRPASVRWVGRRETFARTTAVVSAVAGGRSPAGTGSARSSRPPAPQAGPPGRVLAGQVGGDGFRAGVQSLLGQLLTQPDDRILGVRVHRLRTGMRPSRPRLESCLALGAEPIDQLLHPIPGDPVVAGHLALGRPSTRTAVMISWALGHVAPPHEVPTMSRDRCQLCRATSHHGAHYRLCMPPLDA